MGISCLAVASDPNVERFRRELANTPDGHGTLLDTTACLFGSGRSDTRVHKNDPLVLARGPRPGPRPGQYLPYREERPMNDLFLMLAHRFGIVAPSSGDSAGVISELV